MTEPDLFSAPPALARATDPDTSKAAAEQVDVPRLQLAILHGLLKTEGRGANWFELEGLTGVDKASLSPRFKPMVEAWLIESRPGADGAPITRPGGTTREQTVWFITAAGRAAAEGRRAPPPRPRAEPEEPPPHPGPDRHPAKATAPKATPPDPTESGWRVHHDGFVHGDSAVFPYSMGQWEVWRKVNGEWVIDLRLRPLPNREEAMATALNYRNGEPRP